MAHVKCGANHSESTSMGSFKEIRVFRLIILFGIRSKDGARYQNKYIILFKIEDSKIILWREYYNPITAATTFGIPLESIPTSISP